MREILFRGKRIENGEWVDGYYARLYGGKKNKVSRRIYTGYAETDCDNYYPSWFEVIPTTIGQYTGLTDKNGNKIFEGDIVVCRQYIGGNFVEYHIEKGFVEIKYGAFGLHRKQGYYRPFKDWLEDYEIEIIGNVYDNPELLEELKNE